MAFTVDFLINTSDSNYVNKNITVIKSNVQCILKDDTSIVKPVFRTDFDINLYKCNYLYVHELNRYYYRDDISLSNQIMTIACSESDVLMSFRNSIKNINATIERQSNVFNTYLDDSEILTYSNSLVTTKEFPNAMRTEEGFILITNGGD